jgi:HEPN domain-containing protein
MSAPYSPKQRDEAAAWLERADEDINAARVLLSAETEHLATAAFLCQQAAEKLMKGLLALAALPFRKTHNLDKLSNQIADGWPELARRVEPLRWQTSWNFAFRYPGAGEESEPLPSSDELIEVLAAIDGLRSELVLRMA